MAFARTVCPTYGNGAGPTSRAEMERLYRYARIRVRVREMDVPTLLLPPANGSYRLLIDPGVHWETKDGYIMRHELAHVLAGDADEPTLFRFEYPLPPAEMVADVFAFLDLLDDSDMRQGEEWIEKRVRDLVLIDYEYWYLRVPRIARGVVRARELLAEEVDA